MKVLIIGGNAAGMSFAAKYKRNQPNDEVIIIEKRDYISFGGCGLPYFVSGQFDDTERMISRTPEEAIRSGIDVRINTEMVKLDRLEKCVTVLHEGQQSQIDYDILILCTGATPLIPNFGEFDFDAVFTLTTQADGIALKSALQNKENQKVAIIGAGFIGLEVFDAAHHLGKQVTLIERESQIMPQQFSSEMVKDVEIAIQESGADLRLGCTVQQIKMKQGSQGQKTKTYLIETDQGEIEADIIVLSLGFQPNTHQFDLAKAANGALIVDEFSATSDPFIYAVGDCALVHHMSLGKSIYLPLATTANKQARMLADKLAGKDTYLNGFLGSACLKVLDYELASTGLSARLAHQYQVDVSTSYISDKNQTDYYPGQEEIKIKLVYDPKTKQLLGGESVGKKGAVGRVNALAVAITAKMTTQQLGYLDFCYAPPFARTWDALNVAGNVAK